MESSDVKLIGARRSPYCLRARIAMNIKSIEYEFLEELYGFKSEILLESNPVHKKFPVLIHGNTPICESLLIVQYIDEVWSISGPSILPSHPYDRAVARFWAAYVDDKFYPSMRDIAMAEGEEAKEEAVKIVDECLALFEEAFVKCSKGKDFFGGEKIGFLDIAFGSHLAWLKVNEKLNNVKLIDKVKTPNLFKWADKFAGDPSVKEILPETDKLAEFAKGVYATWKASKKCNQRKL